MKHQLINSHLEILYSFDVNDALKILFQCCYEWVWHVQETVSLEQMDDWIATVDNPVIKNEWAKYRTKEHPFLIFYTVHGDSTYRTLKAKFSSHQRLNYHRIGENEYTFSTAIAKIGVDIQAMPFYEAVDYLGELTAEWMLTCPESAILPAFHIEGVGAWQGAPGRNDWPVPESWVKTIVPDAPKEMLMDREMRMVFTLDALFSVNFEG